MGLPTGERVDDTFGVVREGRKRGEGEEGGWWREDKMRGGGKREGDTFITSYVSVRA